MSEKLGVPMRSASWASALDRVEEVYLRVLRATVLLAASAMVTFAAFLLLTGSYKANRSPNSVTIEKASVTADDLVNQPIGQDANLPTAEAAIPVPTKATRDAYRLRLNRYYSLYRQQFEPYRQQEDKQLSLEEFDDRYLRTADRGLSIATGELDPTDDLKQLDQLIAVMRDASTNPKTLALLQKYKNATKVDVRKAVDRIRTETRSGWDSSSTACSDWYQQPYGCASVRTMQVPYTETVVVKEFPKGTLSHSAIFESYHKAYNSLLNGRRSANQSAAAAKRAEIIEGNIAGQSSMWLALRIIGGFLVLMFFFLLIAIERHQRRLSDRVAELRQG